MVNRPAVKTELQQLLRNVSRLRIRNPTHELLLCYYVKHMVCTKRYVNAVTALRAPTQHSAAGSGREPGIRHGVAPGRARLDNAKTKARRFPVDAAAVTVRFAEVSVLASQPFSF